MTDSRTSIVETVKELLPDPRNKIKLDDFINTHLKAFLAATELQHFPVESPRSQQEEFLDRLQRYEEAVTDLQNIVVLLAKWGEGEHLLMLEKILRHVGEANKDSNITNIWTYLRWYPVQILMYSGGIAALLSKKYDTLRVLLTTPIDDPSSEEGFIPIVIKAGSGLSQINDAFKWLPGKDDKRVPRSEYLFETMEPVLQEQLFLGQEYERLFDEFEVYFALVHADTAGRNWGPIGRFGWKHDRYGNRSPFNRIANEAKQAGQSWPALRAGMFKGSIERFQEVSEALRSQLSRFSW